MYMYAWRENPNIVWKLIMYKFSTGFGIVARTTTPSVTLIKCTCRSRSGLFSLCCSIRQQNEVHCVVILGTMKPRIGRPWVVTFLLTLGQKGAIIFGCANIDLPGKHSPAET